MIFSWVFACLACVFVDGPVYLAPRLMPMPTLPAVHYMAISGIMVLWALYTMHIGILVVPRLIMRASMALSVALTPPTFTELGQPLQTVYACVALLVGEMTGLILELRVRAQLQAHAHARELAEVERKAFRVINHTSKRIMSNTAQCCDLLLEKLQRHPKALHEDHDHVVQMLNTTRAQSVSGFQMCCSMLLQASVVASINRATTNKQLLASILFNAIENALQHGKAEGPVTVEAEILHSAADETNELKVSVSNRPGANHTKLRAAAHVSSCDDMFQGDATLDRSSLQGLGVGRRESTFLGLSEMRVFAKAFRPAAHIHLWVHADAVVFELRVQVAVVSTPPPKGEGACSPGGSGAASASESSSPSLPAGLAFVCCDDDELPRLFASILLEAASASADESVVLGGTHEEVTGLVERIVAMGRRLGPARVVGIIDQNLDGYEQHGFLGTELVGEIRRKGFEGVLIIQSANDDLEDERMYVAAGADGSIGKAVRGGVPDMLAVIGRLWHRRFGETP